MPQATPFSPNLPDTSSWFIALYHWIVSAYPVFLNVLKQAIGVTVGISIPLSVFFFIGIIYCVENLKRIRQKEAEVYDTKVEQAFETADSGDTVMAHRWENALTHIESPNPNDWKQAILEADIILDDLLTKMGYRGESVGEKLKRVEPGDMKSLREAWDAHMVRNRIAHDGSAYALTQHEAKQVIHLYRKVFEEFFYI
jgi:hypothetical protein